MCALVLVKSIEQALTHPLLTVFCGHPLVLSIRSWAEGRGFGLMVAILLLQVQVFQFFGGVVISVRFAGCVSATVDVGVGFTIFFELDPPLDQVVLLLEGDEGLESFYHHVESFLIHLYLYINYKSN